MSIIEDCAKAFKHLVETTSYIFHAANRSVRVIELDFKESDFHHLAGLQYLTDINIPRNKNKTLEWILDKDKPLTDEYLKESVFYKGKDNDEKDIEKRIEELCFLEKYLDEKNIIRLFSPKDGPNNSSLIKCDYIIESRLKERNTTVYIFLKHRAGENSPCGIISFGVKKNVAYGGQNLYWMLKDKIIDGNRVTIFRHTKYSEEQLVTTEKLYFGEDGGVAE